MKTYYWILFGVMVLGLASCNSNDASEEEITYDYYGVLKGQGLDCGALYLIEITNLGGATNLEDGIYYAHELPEEYQLDSGGVLLNAIPLPSSETVSCTALGPAYPHLKVIAIGPAAWLY